MRAVITRLIIFASALFISSILIIIGLGFLVWSSFLYLNTTLTPYVAALISGLIAIVVAGLLFVILSSLTKGAGDKKSVATESESSKFVDASQIIEDYPDDKYGPSCLILGFTLTNRPVHIQCSYPSRPLIKIITLY